MCHQSGSAGSATRKKGLHLCFVGGGTLNITSYTKVTFFVFVPNQSIVIQGGGLLSERQIYGFFVHMSLEDFGHLPSNDRIIICSSP